MHLDEGQIQGLLHGEAGAATGASRAHLEACAECRARLAAAEREEAQVFELLRRLDHPVPAVDPRNVVSRASRRADPWMRWAAGIVLALAAAGVAYAAPGSPLREWVNRAVQWAAGRGQSEAVRGEMSGIAVEPGRRLAIVFATPQAQGIAAVTLVDGSQIVVRTRDAASRFTVDAERLLVVTGDTLAGYEIDVPRGAPWVEIRAGDRRLLLKQGARVVTDAPIDSAGRYVLQLATPRP